MATQTARTLIARSLREINALAVGETPTGAEAADALVALNELLESWSLERLMIWSIGEVSKTLTGGTATYTIGSGGAIDTARPQRIENAWIRDAANLDLPVRLLTRDEYASIYLKQTQTTWPRWLYMDDAYPLATITLWPVPSASDKSLRLMLWQPLTAISSLDTSINLPPGYSRALRTHLAIELAAEYGRPIPDTLIATGLASKEAIKSQRSEGVAQEMQMPGLLVGAGKRYWDYRTGEYL